MRVNWIHDQHESVDGFDSTTCIHEDGSCESYFS